MRPNRDGRSVGRPKGDRVFPRDVPATRCAACGYVWFDGGKPRKTRTMCRKCGTVKPEYFSPDVLPGYGCRVCDKFWYPRQKTIDAGRVRCDWCGSYYKNNGKGDGDSGTENKSKTDTDRKKQ